MAKTTTREAGHAAKSMMERGLALQQQGRLREAEACFQTILHRDPGHADASNAMGTLAVAAERVDVAINYFTKALEKSPRDVRYLNNLGNALALNGKPEEGIPYLERALKLRPSMYEALCNLGRALRKLGQAEKGLPFLERAAALRPAAPEAFLAWAETLTDLGRGEDAGPLYRAAIVKGGGRAAALYGLASSVRQTPEKNVLDEIEAAVAQLGEAAAPAQRALLGYAGSKTCMDLKQYDDAFNHLQRAKAVSRAKYDMTQHDARQKRLTALFNLSFLRSRSGWGDASEVPVFIVGMPRAGTSLAEQILASHPGVHGAGELNYVHDIANQLMFSLGDAGLFVDKVVGLGQDEVKALASSYLAKLVKLAPGMPTRITDKMPHNFTFLGFIAMLLPRARVIHMRRNPLDNCFSIYSNMFSASHAYADDLATLGRYYRAYSALMEHWHQVLPGMILDVQYEDLVSDQEAVTRRMLDFIGLDWDPACLEFFANERSVSTISRWQVRQPIYKSSIERWRPYERHLGPLIDALGLPASN